MNEFDLRERAYTGRMWTYRLEDPSHSIGDAIAVDANRFLVIERDPRGLGGTPGTFRFPFQTIEDVVVLDHRTLGVLDDNDFPFSSGRTPGRPDDNEFITVRLSRGLQADPRILR